MKKKGIVLLFLAAIILMTSCTPRRRIDKYDDDDDDFDVHSDTVTAKRQAEYDISRFDAFFDSAHSVTIKNSNTFEKTVVTDSEAIVRLCSALKSVRLSFEGETSKGIYDSVCQISFRSEYDEIGSPILISNGQYCYYKINRLAYYETGVEYLSRYHMEGSDALIAFLSEYVSFGIPD